MAEYVVFGGTTEGRLLAETLRDMGRETVVCVTTEYGETMLPLGGSLRVHTGKLPPAAMAEFLRATAPRVVLDATHPYAESVSKSIAAVCAQLGLPRVRVLRERSAYEGAVEFDALEAAIEWLNGREETIFSSLGSREAKALTAVRGYRERLWLRVLPSPESLRLCQEAGYPPQHIICMHGPFSQELNEAMFRHCGAGILLTKESGAAGGFREKLEAARALGMKTAVLRRPAEEGGLSLGELKRRIEGGEL